MRYKLSFVFLAAGLLVGIPSVAVQFTDLAKASDQRFRGPGPVMHQKFGEMINSTDRLKDEVDSILKNMSSPKLRKAMEDFMNNIGVVRMQMDVHMKDMQNPGRREKMQSMMNTMQELHGKVKNMLNNMSEPILKKKLEAVREKIIQVRDELKDMSKTPYGGRRFMRRNWK